MAKESYQELLLEINPENLDKLKTTITYNAQNIEKIVNEIVNDYCKPLDILMAEIHDLLNDSIRPSDEELDEWACKLSSCLYFVGEGVETIGVKQDVSKAYKIDKYSKAYDAASGTIADKTAVADLKAQEESLVNSVYTRAYKKANRKLDAGSEMLSSIKKVISRRMAAFGLSVRDKSEFR